MQRSMKLLKNLLGKNPWEGCIEDCLTVSELFESDNFDVGLATIADVFLENS